MGPKIYNSTIVKRLIKSCALLIYMNIFATKGQIENCFVITYESITRIRLRTFDHRKGANPP